MRRRFASSGPVHITLLGGQSGLAELAGAKDFAVARDELEVRHGADRRAGVREAFRNAAPNDASGGLGVTTPVALRYPNGRVHETALDFEVRIGDRFELYGHTWIAKRRTSETRRRCTPIDQHRVLCVLVV
jgi:hypothetical protein